MDMREMVDKVKRKEPLYGHTSLSPHLQGVAARNSRYAGVFIYVIPWANFVNHNQVCMTRSLRSRKEFRIPLLTLLLSSMGWILQNTTGRLKES